MSSNAMNATDGHAMPTEASRGLRVFLGTYDTAFCLSALAAGFRENGCSTTTMVTQRHPYRPNTHYDIVRGREILRQFDYQKSTRLVNGIGWRLDAALGLAINGIASPTYLDHDLFVFLMEPWAPEPILYPLLKRLGKKVVVYYLGSDVRHMTAFSQEYGVDISALGRDRHLDPLEAKIRRIRWGELYSDVVYSVPDQAGLQIRPYQHAHVPLDFQSDGGVPGRTVPVILHAPSRQDIKGTSFVVEAVEALRQEGLRFEFKLLTGLPREKILEALSTADIVVDELLLHGPGVLSAEAMTAGCAVATRIIEPAFPCFDPPVCAVRPDTVLDQLRRLIVDVPFRVDVAIRGQAWARRTFAPVNVARKILRDLEGHAPPDYRPRFYLERFRAPRPLSRYTRWLSLRVAERCYPEDREAFDDAARRGLLAAPSKRSFRS